MNEITIDQLYELYLDTAAKCNSQVTSMKNDELEYNLFEEFDIGVTSFFHDDSLQKLLSAGKINSDAVCLSEEIRRIWFRLNAETWTADQIRTIPGWKQFFAAGDKLNSLLQAHT